MAQHMSQARKPSLMSLTPSNLKHLANVRHELEHSNNSTAFRGGKGIKTEIIMRKDKLTPAKLQHIKEATQSLSSEDVSLLTEIFNCGDVARKGVLYRAELHSALSTLGINCTNKELDDLLKFADADGSMAIDLEEWLMLVGLLIQPPYEESELASSFELLFDVDENGDVALANFMQVMHEVLPLCLSDAELGLLPNLLDEFVVEFDKNNESKLHVSNCIQLLVTEYNDLPSN